MSTLRTVLRRLRRQSSGAVMVEFSLASIVFFMTIFGTIEFGRAIWIYNVVAFSAKEGARWAAVHAATATDTDVQTYVRSKAFGMVVTVTTTWPCRTAGCVVQVRSQQTFTPVTSLLPNATLTLRSTAQMLILR